MLRPGTLPGPVWLARAAAAHWARAACRSARSALPIPPYAASRINGVAKREATAGAAQHAPLQQLVDGALQLDGGHHRRPAGQPEPAAPREPARHDVADDGGVPQHGSGVRRQRVDAGGQDRGQVAGQQPAAERPGREPPAAPPSAAGEAAGTLVSAPRSCSRVTSSAR